MNNSTSFNDLAEGIISNSIKKAIFIDDEASKPFSENSITNEFCSNLFNSFYENNSVIDICPYSKNLNVSEKILSGRNDLIILDWELSQIYPKYQDTLEIVKTIISNESPHFLCIYTNEKHEVFQDIIIKIKAYLNSYKSQLSYQFSELETFLDGCGLDYSNFLTTFNELIKDVLLSKNSNQIESSKKIIDVLKIFFKDDFSMFMQTFKDLTDFYYKFLGFEKQSECSNCFTNVYKEQNCLIGNNTIVLIVQKQDVAPQYFIKKFTDSLLSIPHNFLTLVSLEYRNKFFEQSFFLSKELQTINENAFYHHILELGNDFEEFIHELWKYDNTSFLNVFKSTVIQTFPSFKDEYKIAKRIEDENNISLELAKLNAYYNLSPKLFKTGQILFGDMFTVSNCTNNFFLCITAQCDCLHPSKISNNFFFIKGELCEVTKDHIINADSDFKSFVILNNSPKLIDWKSCKPFTIYISNENNAKEKSINTLFKNQNISLTYFNSLKENYTQRLSNNAFGYASRVGISFAKIKE